MEIMEIARMLGQKLSESQEYKNFCVTRDKCLVDEKLKVKLDEFKVQKSVLDSEKENPNADEKLIDAVSARVEELYQEITNYPDMKAYNKAEEDLNILMTAINMTITSYIHTENVSGNMSQDCDDESEDGCTHDCRTCHGCH